MILLLIIIIIVVIIHILSMIWYDYQMRRVLLLSVKMDAGGSVSDGSPYPAPRTMCHVRVRHMLHRIDALHCTTHVLAF